jgi:hypothetical protein
METLQISRTEAVQFASALLNMAISEGSAEVYDSKNGVVYHLVEDNDDK